MWNFDRKGTELVSGFQGVTTPLRELIAEIESRGWQADVEFSKPNRQYVAEGKNPHGESLEGTGPTDKTAMANLLVKIMRQETIRSPMAKLALWNTTFTNNMDEIAKAYAAGPIYDPKAAPAWKELADDSMKRAQVLQQELHVEVTPDPEPYESVQEMCQDVHQKKHFFVSNAHAQHPLWSTEQNIAFRIVHDVLGHCVSGGDFGWEGENRACAAHFPLLSPSAQKALFTECIGQTAAAAYYRSFMAQKVFYMDDFIEKVQEEENAAGHTGVHPSQSLAPAQMPQVQPSTSQGLPWATQVPHEDFSGGLPVFGSTYFSQDPNANWSSGIEPMPSGEGYVWGGDPLDAAGVQDNALKVNTGWEKWKNHVTGEDDLDSMKLAIVNAFRAVLLSPRKDLRWNAIHYQDISDIPATVTDPKRYWDQLEQRRVQWNTARGFSPDSHKPYFKELGEFRKFVALQHKDLDPVEAQEKADKEFMHMWMEEENRIEADPKNADMPALDVENKVAREITKRLKGILRPSNEDTDYGHEQMHMLGADQLDLQGQEAGKYGAWMGSHLKAIAQLSSHVDEILQAALEDVREHDGTGHHFRAKVLSLGVSGVGPKVCSFAWLLLQPATSQLATIDSHMMQVLGHDYAKDMNDRDYFKFERKLAAGRDALGYGDRLPLGQFQWGMWDAKRTGEGTHQDHSALKVAGPTPYDQVDWSSKLPTDQNWVAPQWWDATLPARDQVGRDWDQNVAPQFPRTAIPKLATTDWSRTPPFNPYNLRKKPQFQPAGDTSGIPYTWDDPRLDEPGPPNIGMPDDTPRCWYCNGFHRAQDCSMSYEDRLEQHQQTWDEHDAKVGKRKVSGSMRIPYILSGARVWVGMPGETFMNLARRQLGLTMEEVWQKLPEESFSAGVYDPNEHRLFPQDHLDPLQQEDVIKQVSTLGNPVAESPGFVARKLRGRGRRFRKSE